jgi:hypothetical protein
MQMMIQQILGEVKIKAILLARLINLFVGLIACYSLLVAS